MDNWNRRMQSLYIRVTNLNYWLYWQSVLTCITLKLLQFLFKKKKKPSSHHKLPELPRILKKSCHGKITASLYRVHTWLYLTIFSPTVTMCYHCFVQDWSDIVSKPLVPNPIIMYRMFIRFCGCGWFFKQPFQTSRETFCWNYVHTFRSLFYKGWGVVKEDMQRFGVTKGHARDRMKWK